jgi:hypothetical protein
MQKAYINGRLSRSEYFKFRFLQRIVDIRSEFAELHLRDEKLDDFLKYHGTIETMDRQIVVAGRSPNILILPQHIEEVAERLRILAAQIKE